MKMQLLLIFGLIVFMSCKKEGPLDPPTCNNCTPNSKGWIWNYTLDSLDGTEFLFSNPILYNGNPIFGIYRFDDCFYGSADRITCLDSSSGRKLWSINPADTCGHIENIHVKGNNLIVHLTEEILAYNLFDLSVKWSHPITGSMKATVGSSIISENIYVGLTFEDIENLPISASLLEIEVESGSSREICKFERSLSGEYPLVNPPSLWINSVNGDSVILFTVSLSNFSQGPFGSRQSLHAYDLKSGTYRWQVDSIGIATNNNRRVEVYENKVYVLTDWRVHCFDAFTGQKIWVAEMPHHTQQIDFTDSRPLAVKGKLIVNSTSDYMYCFDANTGQHLWTVNDYTATANQDLLEHNGVIYLSSMGNGRFLGVDLETGQILLNERSPNRNSDFAGYNVIVNKEKNLLFVNDFKTAYAYRPVR